LSAHPEAGSAPASAAEVPVAQRRRIDDLLQPLSSVPDSRLDREIVARLEQIAPLRHLLVVANDHGATGIEPAPPRMHGSMAQELQRIHAAMIGERDPLAAHAQQEWRPLVGTVEQHVSQLRARVRNPDLVVGWLQRNAERGGFALAVMPGRAWLSRLSIHAFSAQVLDEPSVLALFYAAQRLAVALEMRAKPYIPALLALRFTAREVDVLRAGLRGASDDEIAAGLGLSVDAIRYYFKKFKHRVPVEIGHLRPRDLSRVLHQLGKL